MKGRRGKNKPRVRRMFARVKKTLYTFRDGRIRVTVKPGKSTWSSTSRKLGSRIGLGDASWGSWY